MDCCNEKEKEMFRKFKTGVNIAVLFTCITIMTTVCFAGEYEAILQMHSLDNPIQLANEVLNAQGASTNTNMVEEGLMISEDDAYDSVYDYIDSTIGADTIYQYQGYIILDEETEEEYVIKVRSYTSAIGYYYVNKHSGEVYSQWINPITNEPEQQEFCYTIDAAELERLHSKNDIETEVIDGTYFYCMRTDTNGHPDIFGDVSRGCSNEYSYDENYVVIHGSPNYILDDIWTFTEDNTLEVKYWGFRYNEDTIFEAVGGNDLPDTLTVSDFIDYANLCKDTGLALIIDVKDGLANSFRIAS